MDFKQVSRCNSSLDTGRVWLDRSEFAITRSPITAPSVVMSAHEATRLETTFCFCGRGFERGAVPHRHTIPGHPAIQDKLIFLDMSGI